MIIDKVSTPDASLANTSSRPVPLTGVTSSDHSVTITSSTGAVDLSVGVSGGYSSLTGAGKTATPGDLTQTGGFTVNAGSTTSMGIRLNDSSTYGCWINSNGSGGGAGINDNSGGGILFDTGGAGGGITLSSNGSISIFDSSSTGIVINEGTGPIAMTANSGGITLSSNSGGIALFGTPSTRLGTNNTLVAGQVLVSNTEASLIFVDGISPSAFNSKISCYSGQILIGGPATSTAIYLQTPDVIGISSQLGAGQNAHIFIGESSDSLQFFGFGSYARQQTVTGSKGGNAALASLMAALRAYNLVFDSTT